MMREMRSLLLPCVAVAALALSTGCAHQSELHESTMSASAVTGSTHDSSPPPSSQEPRGEVIAVDQQVTREEAPPARPRLTQTVTLGQSNGEATYTAPPPVPAQGQGGNTQNVIVNNNVVVNQPPAVYGGWGGYGGYGTYGYGTRGGGYGVRADGRSSSRGATWGNTGWEGARGRPAAAGATPGVGGNWAPAPSYGPSQMR
jgi:hypothetical protein